MTFFADTGWVTPQTSWSCNCACSLCMTGQCCMDPNRWTPPTYVVISDRDWNAMQTFRYPKDAEGRYLAEITQDPEELPDDQIVPDNTDPLPPEPDIKTDAVPVDDE